MAMLPGTAAAKALAAAGVTPQSLNQAINAMRKGRRADTATAADPFEARNKHARDPTEAPRVGKLDPIIGRDAAFRRHAQLPPPHTKDTPTRPCATAHTQHPK